MANDFEARVETVLADLFEPARSGADDRALLDRFRRDGSPSAFEVLVARHGGLVRGACRRILGDGPDADDAFQATFVVLARRAEQVRHADRLGPWLYGVATRVALKARTRRARRREVAVDPARHDRAERTQPSADPGVLAIVDAEIARVTPKLRAAVVLCLVEGVSVEEAAGRLGCPVGTVKSRLARGRAALQTRLIRRGITPGLVAATLAAPLASADAALLGAVPLPLIRSTVAQALAPVASLRPPVAALARGVAPTMLFKTTAAASTVVLGGMVLAGSYLVAAPQDPPPASAPTRPIPEPAQAGPDIQDLALISRDHLKQIHLACQLLIQTDPEGKFPAPAILGTDGQPKLSWRVALLPYLGYDALYRKFHRDEPWDSPHNKGLLTRMPAVFESPDSPAPAIMTRFRGFQGPGTVFEGPTGTPIPSITDGTSLTIWLTQAAEPTIWTKPGEIPVVAQPVKQSSQAGDLPIDPWRNLPKLLDAIQWRVAMADGFVGDLPPGSPALLRAMITRNGGEVFPGPRSLNQPAKPQPAASSPTQTPINRLSGAGGLEATPAVTGSADLPALEQRLRSVEAKLDRLIERIEANGPPPKNER